MKRRAKIVCTLGPAVGFYQGIRSLVHAGMDVARLNFSHGAHSHHEQSYRRSCLYNNGDWHGDTF